MNFSHSVTLVSVWNMTVMSWAASQILTQCLDPHEKVRTDELMRSRISLLSVWPQGLLTIWWPFMNLLWIYWSECVWNFEMTPRVILVSLRLQLDQCAVVMTPTNMWWRFYDVHAFTQTIQVSALVILALFIILPEKVLHVADNTWLIQMHGTSNTDFMGLIPREHTDF